MDPEPGRTPTMNHNVYKYKNQYSLEPEFCLPVHSTILLPLDQQHQFRSTTLAFHSWSPIRIRHVLHISEFAINEFMSTCPPQLFLGCCCKNFACISDRETTLDTTFKWWSFQMYLNFWTRSFSFLSKTCHENLGFLGDSMDA